MRRALALAAEGVGLVSPNPLVGCVIVSPEGDVVGEGSYIYDNVTHAEGVALAMAGKRSVGATAYVSLEPHDHHSRTRPCTEALIEAGIARVVCPIEDPNPLVSGRGFERLRRAGVNVTTGILADEAARQNEKFICWHRKQRPFVHLKMAVSLDGRISTGRGISAKLTSDAALRRVHDLRHEHDAILIGANTAIVDDPSLTDRSGKPRRRPLVRVVLDNRTQTPLDAMIVTSARDVPTFLFSDDGEISVSEALVDAGVRFFPTDARDLSAVLADLRENDIQSVLVEGGAAVAGSFIDARLVDKVTFFIAPVIIGGGDAPAAVAGRGAASLADAFHLKDVDIARHGDCFEITGYPRV
ncbi:MAG: bifunctional diaminohydroxyphosphoribosylaminopyrimidine deaminase/5-amino-6-(5-phosphoribosylamino)uracil reductase RibD [Chloracidobacterium sp.]|nr:bifunctional diaminohydroxyphosphoribosylaminopyrimidine deaminase/5-amino-6-(5-phosphoribosylamino)uracil reductase RibD [Chloracidobacterium sp.]